MLSVVDSVPYFQVDRLFDILNSHSPYGKGWKGPARPGNLPYVKEILIETIAYLQSLKLSNGQLVKDCRRNTFIIGFEVGIDTYSTYDFFSLFPALLHLLTPFRQQLSPSYIYAKLFLHLTLT